MKPPNILHEILKQMPHLQLQSSLVEKIHKKIDNNNNINNIRSEMNKEEQQQEQEKEQPEGENVVIKKDDDDKERNCCHHLFVPKLIKQRIWTALVSSDYICCSANDTPIGLERS